MSRSVQALNIELWGCGTLPKMLKNCCKISLFSGFWFMSMAICSGHIAMDMLLWTHVAKVTRTAMWFRFHYGLMQRWMLPRTE